MTSASTPQVSDATFAQRAATADGVAEIEAHNVSKAYGGGKFAKTVIRDCSFAIERGKLTVMIGHSGCGNSTLICLLARFERPHAGTIHLRCYAVAASGAERLILCY